MPKESASGWNVLQFPELESTSDYLLGKVDELADRTVVRAVVQTRGRGRLGRTWLSDGDKSLTFSILHALPGSPLPNAAQGAALAIARLLRREGIRASLKWPNDVLLGGRKIAGILAETRGNHLVIGIGINLRQEAPFFQSIDQKAASIAGATGLFLGPEETLQAFLAEWSPIWETLVSKGFAALFSEWADYAKMEGTTWLLRRNPAAAPEPVAVLGLLPDGRLRIRPATGPDEDLPSGDLLEAPPARLP